MSFFKRVHLSFRSRISTFVCILFFLVIPLQAHAQYFDVVQATKELVADPIAWIAADQIIKGITAQTVNWINSGFQGNPAYVTDPGQFFLNVADNTAGQYLSTNSAAMNALCSPFRAQVRLALVKNYLSQNQVYACNLTTIKNNYEQFTRDFDQGGWSGWFEVTQNNQNNPYGSYLDNQNQLSIQIGNAQNKYSKQLDWGRGILSWEKCPAGHELDPALGTGDCSAAKTTITPGSVIQDQLSNVLGSGVARVVQADEIDEIIGALLNQVIGRVVGGIGSGLFGASQPSNGQTSFASQLANDPGLQPSNPDPTQFTGGTVQCTNSPPTTTCTPDPITGIDSCITTPGTESCSNTPVSIPPIDVGGGNLSGGTGGPSGGGGGGDGTNSHTTPSQVQAVIDAKNSVIAQGINPSSNDCATFEITRRAAIAVGGGVLEKGAGAGCTTPAGHFSVDIIAYPNGDLIDVLSNAGINGTNGPEWVGDGTTASCSTECHYVDPNSVPAYPYQ